MTRILNQIFKQPLFHFLLVGAVIFAAYQLTGQQSAMKPTTKQVINVTRTSLLNFMQYRAQAFQPELFNEKLDEMEVADINDLVDAFVREEALHREALALGMDQGDYIIRQRLIQKVEFLLENLVNQSLIANPEEIEAFYIKHLADYQVDAVYTFTHIFFDSENRGWEAAEQDAQRLLDSEQINNIAFNDASQYGDRYPFLRNYVERTHDFVVNNFNDNFVNALNELSPSMDQWMGPFTSRYGLHLVLLKDKSESYVPELTQIIERVTEDWRYEAAFKIQREAEDKVVAGYEIHLDLGRAQP